MDILKLWKKYFLMDFPYAIIYCFMGDNVWLLGNTQYNQVASTGRY